MATVSAKVYEHHKKSDGTYNVKICIHHKDQRRYLDTNHFVVKKQLTKDLKIQPLWQYQPLTEFKERYRNIFVLKKTTFPGSKILRVSLTEKQISGRTVNLKIKYGDILEADTF